MDLFIPLSAPPIGRSGSVRELSLLPRAEKGAAASLAARTAREHDRDRESCARPTAASRSDRGPQTPFTYDVRYLLPHSLSAMRNERDPGGCRTASRHPATKFLCFDNYYPASGKTRFFLPNEFRRRCFISPERRIYLGRQSRDDM